MDKEEFIKVCVEESFTENEAAWLWDGKPNDIEPTVSSAKAACRGFLPTIRGLRKSGYHKELMDTFNKRRRI